MENSISITEKRLIRSLLTKKTDKELAEMLGRPVEIISDFLTSLDLKVRRPVGKVKKQRQQISTISLDQPPDPPKQKRIKKKKPKSVRVQEKLEKQRLKEKDGERKRLLKEDHERARRRKKEIESKKLPTRVIDLTGTVAVRLNSKTTVWVKPGYNIEELKKRYKIK